MKRPKARPRSVTLRTTLLLAAVTLLLAAMGGGCASQTKQVQSKPVAFWPPYPDEPRVQYLTSFSASSDIAPKKSSLDQLIYGKEGEKILIGDGIVVMVVYIDRGKVRIGIEAPKDVKILRGELEGLADTSSSNKGVDHAKAEVRPVEKPQEECSTEAK